MTRDMVMNVMRELIFMAAMTAGPVLLGGLLTGLVMGVLQSATQIQETSLTFIPKLVVVSSSIIFGGPWALDKLVLFTTNMFEQVGTLAPAGAG